MFSYLREDIKRYKNYGKWFLKGGFWITLCYRFGFWAKHLKIKIFRLPFLVIYSILVFPFRIFMHVYIPTNAVIGPGILFQHPFLIFFSPNTVLGENCTIYHDVTFGFGPKEGEPVLNNNVVVFPGARILGGINIGEHAHISANSVVTRDVQDHTIISAQQVRPIPMSMGKKIVKEWD